MKKLEWVIREMVQNVEDLEGIEVGAETSLIASGYIDSYDIISMIEHFETACDVDIPFENVSLEDFETPQSILNLLARFGAKI